MKNNKDIQALIQCDKWGFRDGEKKQFSGCLNRWINTSEEGYVLSYTFLYYQPVTYDYSRLTEKETFTLTKRQQKLLCIKKGYYSLPFEYYGQRLTAWQVLTFPNSLYWKGEAALQMVSGDDDIITVNFPLEDMPKVKKFIQDNYKTLSSEQLYNWVLENGYSFS